ncbi:MAG: MmcQ/YjbR family DNA-binding protein [Bacteroidetes bacterium]|nr:MmcQ/YjbR family DNA-binding protein [Bacteroidota bacterium]
MDVESFRLYCLSKPDVTESFPFDQVTLVFMVNGKMFALTSLNKDFTINLKCDPERAISLREEHPCIIPGFHMNKVHWNTLIIDGTLNDPQIRELIDHSYELVKRGKRK